MRTTLTTAAITAGAVMALLVGCASGGSDPTDDGTLTYEDSPLAVYWESIGGSQDPEDADAQMARSEEIVAACMQDEGFEYTPQDMSGMSRELRGRGRRHAGVGLPGVRRAVRLRRHDVRADARERGRRGVGGPERRLRRRR